MFELKNVSGKQVLYVMAASAEYGVHLKRRITPLFCQVGPVEAALNVTRTICEVDQLDLIVSLGSAGSRLLEQAQVYQVSSVGYRDMDASPLGFARGETPFLDLPATLELPHHIPDIPSATLSTGANIVSGDAYDGIDAQLVDMETWAIKRACMSFNIPLIGLRGVSDGAEPLEGLMDWTRYLEVIDERLGLAVDRLEQALISNAIEQI